MGPWCGPHRAGAPTPPNPRKLIAAPATAAGDRLILLGQIDPAAFWLWRRSGWCVDTLGAHAVSVRTPRLADGRVIVGAVVGLAYPTYFLLRRLWRRSFTEVETNVSMTVLTVIGTIWALLLAFVAVSVWQSYGDAETAVVNEANSVGQLARDLAMFDSTQSREARHMLREYANIVVTVEWHDTARGQSNREAWDAFDRMFLAIGKLEPDTPQREALMPEIWANANDVLEGRRTRLHTAEAAVPLRLWAVVLIGSALTLGTTVVLSPTRFNLWIIGLLAMSMALVFYLIAAMDRPFAG